MARKEGIKIKGFGRMQLVNKKTGKIECDSGWHQNTITESGFDDFIVGAMGGIANSSQVTHLQLGTQTTAANSTQTTLSGEFGTRKAASNSLQGNGTMRATANWGTNEATQSNIGAIGAYGTSSGGSICNVLTVSTSAKTTDQQLNCTVEFRFS